MSIKLPKTMDIVQHIIIQWDQSYRGAPRSTRRNQVLEYHELPDELFEQRGAGFPIHLVSYSSVNDFASPITNRIVYVNDQNHRFYYECVELIPDEEKFRISYHYNATYCGAPRRMSEKVLELDPDEYGKISINGRFSGGYNGPWYYRKQIFNVIRTSEKDCWIFKHASVSKEFQDMQLLW